MHKFIFDLLIDFSTNLDPNFVIFDYVDLPSSYISKNIKIPNVYLISSSNLIEFQRIHKNYLNSLWIQPLFTSKLSNS